MRLPILVGVLTSTLPAFADTPPPPVRTIVKAARVFDGTGDRWRPNTALLVEGAVIKAVGTPADLAKQAPGATVIDLGDVTLLPGLVDAHTHVMVSPPLAGDDDYAQHLIKQSIAARAIAATANARRMLMYGFTALRDVESEGAMYADVDVAQAIERGIVVGPRMQVSTRGLAPTHGYLPDDIAWDVEIPSGAQLVDGVDEIRKAIREQVKHGATWIKVYADFGGYESTRADRRFRSRTNFTVDEMTALVAEAHRLGRRVAAHATGWDGIDQALRAGVDSIEHGLGLTDDLAQRMVTQGVSLVPTITAFREGTKTAPDAVKRRIADAQRASLKVALARGVRIANGSDVGSFSFEINPVSDLEALVELGATPPVALRAATSIAGALFDPQCAPDQKECLRGRVGRIAVDSFADLIAVEGDPTTDIKALRKLRFVMANGVVQKR